VLKTLHCIGAVWLLLAPPTGIFAFVVRNLDFHAMGRFDREMAVSD
jgi:hypothetical protein